jgi:hypothetical protein
MSKDIWLPTVHTLPAKVSCTLVFSDNLGEFTGAFSSVANSSALPLDTLTWRLSPNHDILVSSNNAEQTHVERNVPEMKFNLGESYQFCCVISISQASFWVNNEKYATATFPAGIIPTNGYFGFLSPTNGVNITNTNEEFLKPVVIPSGFTCRLITARPEYYKCVIINPLIGSLIHGDVHYFSTKDSAEKFSCPGMF